MSKPHLLTQIQQPVAQKSHLPFDSNLTMLSGAVGLLIILSMLGKREDNKQGKSYWGGFVQLRSARKIARSQIPAYSGKKGYTVTRSPKTGNDTNLSEVVFCLIHDMIFPPVKVMEIMGEELTQLLSVN